MGCIIASSVAHRACELAGRSFCNMYRSERDRSCLLVPPWQLLDVEQLLLKGLAVSWHSRTCKKILKDCLGVSVPQCIGDNSLAEAHSILGKAFLSERSPCVSSLVI